MVNAVLLTIQEDGNWLRVVPIAPHVSVDDARLQLQKIRETAASQQQAQQRRHRRAVANSSGIYDAVFESNSVSSGVFNVLLGELQRVYNEAREAGASEQEGEEEGGAVVGKAGWALRRDGDMLYLVRCGNDVLCGTHDGQLALFCAPCHR